MAVIYFLFIKVYSLVKLVTFGLGKPEYRAAGIFGTCLFINVFTIVFLLGLKFNKIILPFLLVPWLLICIKYFTSEKMKERRDSTLRRRYQYASVVDYSIGLTYILGSLLIFIYALRVN